MTTDLIIEYIRSSWTWGLWIFIVCMTSYYIYSFIKEYTELKNAKERKKQLEKELVDLEAQYSEKAAKLEEKINEGKRLLTAKGRPFFGGKGGKK